MGNCFMISSNNPKKTSAKKASIDEKKVNDVVDASNNEIKSKSGLNTPRTNTRNVTDIKIDADVTNQLIPISKSKGGNDFLGEASPEFDIDIQIELDKKRKEKKKKKIISKENEEIFENIKKLERKKKENDIYLIIKCLKTHNVFFDLSENDLYLNF